MFNLHQLWLFKKVVEFGGFSAAAEKLHIAQPSISIQVRRLEKELNIDLFDRIGRRLHLTQAGEELYYYACRILNLAEEAEQNIRSLQDLKGAKIRIGASTTPGMYIIPVIAADFRRQYPDIEIELKVANTRSIEEKLLANSIDLAVLGEEIDYDNNIKIEPLLEDNLVVVCGKEYEIAGEKKISIKKLTEQKFVLREKGSSTRDMVDKLLDEKGLIIKDIWELPSTESIKQVVIANWGLSILSYFSVRSEVSAGCMEIVNFEEDFSLSRNINLAFHRFKKFSPAVQIFYHFLKNSIDTFTLLNRE
ncbi:hypothetical protein BHF71_09090 [Vulcanibacillus modesticaldus]|uniref:HTH lysR-type domain-containing protein n=1 Tax=Vulcanibacillus modesticaldus TaxID=337097 RepID=A0A1D2YUZ1_9BACI|nr:LysR family transcriptional regulator [Vulcanibacillus modesticaldus]OEF99456.1 hypothetical protein BHF71_09090 [Vulcanibacillus modesticaldus]